MRCKACDRLLSDEEATKKDKNTNEYLDMCNKCLYNSDEDNELDWLGDFYIDYEDDDDYLDT